MSHPVRQIRWIVLGTVLLTSLILVLLYLPWGSLLSRKETELPSPTALLGELNTWLEAHPQPRGHVRLPERRDLYVGWNAVPDALRSRLADLRTSQYVSFDEEVSAATLVPVATRLLVDGETRVWLLPGEVAPGFLDRYGMLFLLLPIAWLLWTLWRMGRTFSAVPELVQQADAGSGPVEQLALNAELPPTPSLPQSTSGNPLEILEQAARNAEQYLQSVGAVIASSAPLPLAEVDLAALVREQVPTVDVAGLSGFRGPGPAVKLAVSRLLSPGLDLSQSRIGVEGARLSVDSPLPLQPDERRIPMAVVRELADRYGWHLSHEQRTGRQINRLDFAPESIS